MPYIRFACGKFLAYHIMSIAMLQSVQCGKFIVLQTQFFRFATMTLWYLNTLWQFSGSWLDVVSSLFCSMCCISTRQFHPSTFLPLNRWHLIVVFLVQGVSCHILVFVMWRILWLSIILSWDNMATSTFLFSSAFTICALFFLIMQPMCLLATFMFPTIIGGVRVCSCYIFCIH